MAKTKPTNVPVEEFLLGVVPPKRQSDGVALAEIFREVTGTEPVMWGPTMVGYGSFHYASASGSTEGDWPRVAFSPRKAQLSLYGLKDLPEQVRLLPQLGTYTEGVGCVYVKKLEDVDLSVMRQLIAMAWNRTDG